MIKLYRSASCPDSADIEAVLQDLVVAHQIITVEPDQFDTPLPLLQENSRTISGRVAITIYLKELENFVTDWQRFQSDACYINEDGQIC